MRSVLGIAALVLSGAACAESRADCPARANDNVGSLDFPAPEIPGNVRQARRKSYTLTMGNGASLDLAGKPATLGTIAKLVEPLINERSEIRLQPAPNASFGSVVRVVRAINLTGYCHLVLIGNERFWRSLDHPGSSDSPALPLQTPNFARDTNAIVTIGFEGAQRSPSSVCQARLGNRRMSSAELSDEGYRRLDKVIKRMGGVSAIKDSGIATRDLGVIIQGSGKTPWQCAAGAIYAMQIAGYPSVDLVTF